MWLKEKRSAIITAGAYIISLMIILGGMFSAYRIIDAFSNVEVCYNIMNGAVTDDTIVASMTALVDKAWMDSVDKNGNAVYGCEYDIVFTNRGERVFHDWTISVKLNENDRIDTMWNGEYTLGEDGTLVITPMEYNNVAVRNDEIPIGFIVKTTEVRPSTFIKITGYFKHEVKEYTIFWFINFLLVAWFVILTIRLIVYWSTRKYKQQLEEAIEKAEEARIATYVEKSTRYIVGQNVLVDLVLDTYYVIHNEYDPKDSGSSGRYSDVISEMLDNSFSDEECLEYHDKLNRSRVIELLRNTDEYSFIVHLGNADGEKWASLHVVCVERDINDTPTKAMILKTNITEEMQNRIKNEDVMKEALRQAESANLAKTTFLSNMSHDIRTPMNAIIGFTSIAQNHLDDREQVEKYLSKIAASGNHLLSLINDVLDMSRIESGRIEIEETENDLNEIIDELTDLIKSQATSKKITFIREVNVHNTHVLCDKLRLKEVLLNLLSNSVKYTPEGGHVTLKLDQKEDMVGEYGKYVFSVMDDGFGMSSDFLEHIFEPFEREKTAKTSNIQGTGLGLAIAKNMVEMIGGTIEAASELNKGSRFTVYLDLKLKKEEEIKREEKKKAIESVPSYDLKGKRILVAEDNEINLEITDVILKEAGFIYENAANGQIAVDMFSRSEEGYYDCILMDVQMPVMDGYDATEIIRSMERSDSGLPIIALSANAFDEDIRKSLRRGMNGHISKPIVVDTLIATLCLILQEKDADNY